MARVGQRHVSKGVQCTFPIVNCVKVLSLLRELKLHSHSHLVMGMSRLASEGFVCLNTTLCCMTVELLKLLLELHWCGGLRTIHCSKDHPNIRSKECHHI